MIIMHELWLKNRHFFLTSTIILINLLFSVVLSLAILDIIVIKFSVQFICIAMFEVRSSTVFIFMLSSRKTEIMTTNKNLLRVNFLFWNTKISTLKWDLNWVESSSKATSASWETIYIAFISATTQRVKEVNRISRKYFVWNVWATVSHALEHWILVKLWFVASASISS